jgi:iron complex outermembrane receptor protein
LQWIGGLYLQKYSLDESDFLHLPTAAEATDLPVAIGSLVPALVSQSATARNTVAGALTQGGHPACAGGPSSPTCQQAAAGYIQSLFTNASNPRDFSQDSQMFSVFAQGTWKFNDKWSTSVGARVNHEEKDGRRHAWITSGICAANPAIPEIVPTTASASCPTAALANGLFGNVLGIAQHDISGSRKVTNVSPLVNLQYRASSRSLGYLSISQGYKSGGFDARSNKPPPAGTFEFKDERATTYELGLKTEAASGKAEASVTLFRTDYKDLQTSAFDGTIGFNVGNGSAEVRGFEFEGRWRPVRALIFKASMATLDFKWTKYDGQCSFGLAPTATDGRNCDYSGRNNQLAPHFSGVLSAEHTAHAGSLALTTTLDAVHSGSYLQSPNLDPMLRQDGYTKLNARIGLGDDNGRWQVAVIGRNLTDKTTVGYAADAPLAQALFRARSYYGFVEPPRSVAVEFRIRF